MKKITIANLSEQLNLSKTTVSKALNSCPGIDYSTKQAVTDAAKEQGYVFKPRTADLGIILPSVPDYFWGKLYKKLISLVNEYEISCSTLIYSSLSNPDDALKCIDKILTENILVLIIAVPSTPEIKKLLETVSQKVCIILLEELLEIKNTFYIGENPYQCGYDIAKEYLSMYHQKRNFTIVTPNMYYLTKKRIDGFIAALTEVGINNCIILNVSFDTRTVAASVARVLKQHENSLDCVFSPSGNIMQVCGGIEKLKSKSEIHCIGFENPPAASKYLLSGIIKLLYKQNVNKMSEIAVRTAVQYINTGYFPTEKYTYTGIEKIMC